MKSCGCFARRHLLRIVRNSLWLSLTHCATPPFPQKSRSARLLGCKRPPDGSLSLPTFADFRTAARTVPTGVLTELYAEPSLPLTRKVARRRRDERRESNKYQNFVISPSVIFQKKNDSLALLRCPILFMRLGVPHKIDRCANRCSLYPPPAAVAYVARRWGGTLI